MQKEDLCLAEYLQGIMTFQAEHYVKQYWSHLVRSAKTIPHTTQCTKGNSIPFHALEVVHFQMSVPMILQVHLLFSFSMNALCKQIFPAYFWGTICCLFMLRYSCISAVGCYPRLCLCVAYIGTVHLEALSTFPWDWNFHIECEVAPCFPFKEAR